MFAYRLPVLCARHNGCNCGYLGASVDVLGAGELRKVHPPEARARPSFAASESREALLRDSI